MEAATGLASDRRIGGMNREVVIAKIIADVVDQLRCNWPDGEHDPQLADQLRASSIARQQAFAETIFDEFDDGFVEQSEFDNDFL